MLMQTTITIECGQELETKLTMHEEILRCNSKRFGQVYAKAKPMRELYKKTQSVCDKLAAFVFPEVTTKQFEENGLEEEVHTLNCRNTSAARMSLQRDIL
jgi:hypothetical protein